MLLIFIQQDSQLLIFSIENKILLIYDLDNKNVQMNNSKVGNTDMYHYIFGCFLSPKRVFWSM